MDRGGGRAGEEEKKWGGGEKEMGNWSHHFFGKAGFLCPQNSFFPLFSGLSRREASF